MGVCVRACVSVCARVCVSTRAHVCMRMYVCACLHVCVRVCARAWRERERKRGVRTSFSPKRGCTECEFRFYYYRHFVEVWCVRACVFWLLVRRRINSCTFLNMNLFWWVPSDRLPKSNI